MFKRSDPQQALFDTTTCLSDATAKRLKSTWALGFRNQVLPILFEMEPDFAYLYGSTGRPNFSVARLLGVCLLKELRNLSDQDALDALSFDIRWHYALDVETDDPYLSRRSLVEFRRRLVDNDPEMELIRLVFERVGKQAIEKLGIATPQRLSIVLKAKKQAKERGKQRLSQVKETSEVRRIRSPMWSESATNFLKYVVQKVRPCSLHTTPMHRTVTKELAIMFMLRKRATMRANRKLSPTTKPMAPLVQT
jgi:hypothetical protein